MHPVDELGQLRAEIAALKARENELRATIAMRRRDLSGGRYEAEFKAYTRRVFLSDKLPDYIRNAPELWEERATLQLRVTDKTAATHEPEDDVIVIESWRHSA